MSLLSLDQARRIVQTSLETARSLELAPLSVAVLDVGGHLKAFERDDGAGILRPQIAIGKAWGALGMGLTGQEFQRRAEANAPFLAALAGLSDGRVVPSPGGVLILVDDLVVGAVGVSGDRGDQDERCAVVGIGAAGLTADAAPSAEPRPLAL